MAHDILIVDDETDIRVLTSGILEDEGYITREAGDSDAALSSVAARPPSLVVLDIWLQGSELDGLGILKEIIEAEPTDGLWNDGRNDSDQLGMTYTELEKVMQNKNDPNYKKYVEIRKKNLHKINPIPVCKFDD